MNISLKESVGHGADMTSDEPELIVPYTISMPEINICFGGAEPLSIDAFMGEWMDDELGSENHELEIDASSSGMDYTAITASDGIVTEMTNGVLNFTRNN